jgi:hypothetical protein
MEKIPNNRVPQRPESETLLSELLTVLVDIKYDSPQAFEAIGGENIIETLQEAHLYETASERQGFRNALNALIQFHELATQELDVNAPKLTSLFVEFSNALPIWGKEYATSI